MTLVKGGALNKPAFPHPFSEAVYLAFLLDR